MEPGTERHGVAAGVQDDPSVELRAEVLRKRTKPGEVGVASACGGLDLDADGTTAAVFEHEVDFLARVGPLAPARAGWPPAVMMARTVG